MKPYGYGHRGWKLDSSLELKLMSFNEIRDHPGMCGSLCIVS